MCAQQSEVVQSWLQGLRLTTENYDRGVPTVENWERYHDGEKENCQEDDYEDDDDEEATVFRSVCDSDSDDDAEYNSLIDTQMSLLRDNYEKRHPESARFSGSYENIWNCTTWTDVLLDESALKQGNVCRISFEFDAETAQDLKCDFPTPVVAKVDVDVLLSSSILQWRADLLYDYSSEEEETQEYASLQKITEERDGFKQTPRPFPLEAPGVELRHPNVEPARRPSFRSQTMHEYAFSGNVAKQLTTAAASTPNSPCEDFIMDNNIQIHLRGVTKVTAEGITRKLNKYQSLRISNDRIYLTSSEDGPENDIVVVDDLIKSDYKPISKKELTINRILNETSTKLICKIQFDSTKDMNLAIVDLDSYYGANKPLYAVLLGGSIGGSGSNVGEEKSQIRYKLLKLLGKRSSKDFLEKRGIIKNEPIFGNTLRHLYEMYRQDVPDFVIRIVQLIELPKNIISLGLYRASGNLATIQKIRYHIDKNNLKILDEYKNDSDVLTGSLKLFFRELKEPLIPHKSYEELCKYMDVAEITPKIEEVVKHLVDKLDKPHKKTLLALLHHLLKVESHSDENKMDAYNISIVWGPTLIWPPDHCHENIVTGHRNANKVIELLLRVYKRSLPMTTMLSSSPSSPFLKSQPDVSNVENQHQQTHRDGIDIDSMNALKRNALMIELNENLTNSLKKGGSRDNLTKSSDSLGSKSNELSKTPDAEKKLDLEVLCSGNRERIPEFVLKVVPQIERAIDSEFLYKKLGSNEKLDKIWRKVTKNKSRFNSLEKYNVHDLTWALKTFFIETKSPLIPRNIFERLIFATEERIEMTKLRNTKKEYIKSNLPFRETLDYLLRHLVRVAQHEEQNKMSRHNLATEWAPVLCNAFIQSHEFSPGSCVQVIETLLQIHDTKSAINIIVGDTDSLPRQHDSKSLENDLSSPLELNNSPSSSSEGKVSSSVQVLPPVVLKSRKNAAKNESSLYRVSRYLNNTLSLYDNVPPLYGTMAENVRNEATLLDRNSTIEDRTKL